MGNKCCKSPVVEGKSDPIVPDEQTETDDAGDTSEHLTVAGRISDMEVTSQTTIHGTKTDQTKVSFGFCEIMTQYTIKALVVYYIDFFFDIINGIFLEYPQDIMHFVLFFTFIPIRFVALCLLFLCDGNCGVDDLNKKWLNVFFSAKDAGTNTEINNEYSCLHTFLHGMSRCGVLLRKTRKKGLFSAVSFSRSKFLFIEIDFQRYDSVKIYMNLVTIASVAYLWSWFLQNYQDAGYKETILCDIFSRLYDATSWEMDVSDVTFISAWMVFRLVLNITEDVYFCVEYAWWKDQEYNKKVLGLLAYIFGCRLRKPFSMIFEDEKRDLSTMHSNTSSSSNIVDSSRRLTTVEVCDEDEGRTLFNRRMANFELLFVKIFCTIETYLRFKRKNRNWQEMLANNMSVHKDMACMVFALFITLGVNFFEEHQYILLYISEVECEADGGYCITEDNATCWCSLNMFNDCPTFVAVVGATIMAIASAMRSIITTVFNIWLQPKLSHTTWAMTTAGSDWGDQLVLPQDADITLAMYGYPIKNWINKFKAMQKGDKQLTNKQILQLFQGGQAKNVKDDIEYWLFQGMTCFSLSETKNNPQPILVVKGEWRGGGASKYRGEKNRVRDSMIAEAIQMICISNAEGEAGHGRKIDLDWEKKVPDFLETMKMESQIRGEKAILAALGEEKANVSIEIVNRQKTSRKLKSSGDFDAQKGLIS